MIGPAAAPRDSDDIDTRSEGNTIEMLCWHLDRYDRQRSSTSARASVVLSAGAILFAGNTIVLSRLLEPEMQRVGWPIVMFLLACGVLCALLIMLSLLRSAGVLVTPRGSRQMFLRHENVPASLVFNGTDTIDQLRTFASFQSALAAQSRDDILQAAQIELWVCIHQHRHRYRQLRLAVRYLRYAAISFVFGMISVLTAEVVFAVQGWR
ncbi:MAG TPA: hypothetical protein VFC19_10305 [Candidatus Limnocylindrales bacterium]|nr:hypothetical protein [Candidatus Limnocylindrales bacterium]